MSDTAIIEPTVSTRSKAKKDEKVKKQPPYHVVLHNDDDHSFEYVIGMLRQLFGHTPERGYKMAMDVHTHGRVIVDTTTKERAELKRDQIHAFGPDPGIPLRGEHVGEHRTGGVKYGKSLPYEN